MTAAELAEVSARTISDYEGRAAAFDRGTQDHDVTQNYEALLSSIEGPPPYVLLDFGCGPGRDLAHFRALGHEVIGVEGCRAFVEMARQRTGCEVLEQDFLALALPANRFDGIFANASLFHVPSQELPRVLGELARALRPRGVLFSSNPRGDDEEGWSRGRYGLFCEYDRWKEYVIAAGFDEVMHYYRPPGKPRAEQPWLASVWRKRG